jgi:hypothetical protein
MRTNRSARRDVTCSLVGLVYNESRLCLMPLEARKTTHSSDQVKRSPIFLQVSGGGPLPIDRKQ